MLKIESQKIDCLHRPCSRLAPRSKSNRYACTQKSSKSLICFRCSNSCFLVRNWHCWSRKAFARQTKPQSREKTAKTAIFRHRWQAWKLYGWSRLHASAQGRHKTDGVLSLFFESFLWHFNEKQRAELIFRLSRRVSCKNQENGAGKQLSLYTPLKHISLTTVSQLTTCPFPKSWNSEAIPPPPPPPPPCTFSLQAILKALKENTSLEEFRMNNQVRRKKRSSFVVGHNYHTQRNIFLVLAGSAFFTFQFFFILFSCCLRIEGVSKYISW